MSTNPNNAVGTNAAYDGRTSVKAFNDGIGAYSRGILSGWACSPNTGMTVSLGGDGTTRDIAIAEDVSGNKISVNNISESPISVTMSAAPATNSRIDLIVAYVDNPPQGSATSVDNPGACGLIKVDGTAAADPVAPNDSAIRTAITADGASGSTAYYVVLATITIASGTTDLTSDNIAAGPSAGIGSQNIDFTTFGSNYSTTEQDTGFTWIDGKIIYKKTFSFTTDPISKATTIMHNITNLGTVIKYEGSVQGQGTYGQQVIPRVVPDDVTYGIGIGDITGTKFILIIGSSLIKGTQAYVTLYYTKAA